MIAPIPNNVQLDNKSKQTSHIKSKQQITSNQMKCLTADTNRKYK